MDIVSVVSTSCMFGRFARSQLAYGIHVSINFTELHVFVIWTFWRKMTQISRSTTLSAGYGDNTNIMNHVVRSV